MELVFLNNNYQLYVLDFVNAKSEILLNMYSIIQCFKNRSEIFISYLNLL